MDLQSALKNWPQNPMMGVFHRLRQAAGEKDFVFLGRHVTKDMTLDDVLKTIPQAELESASSVAKALSARAWGNLITPPKSTGQLPFYRAAATAESTKIIVKEIGRAHV